MTTTSHTDCTHPATKAGRAACRRARSQSATRDRIAREAIRDCYFAGIEADELLGMIAQLGIEVDTDADIEEIIASL